MINNFSSDSILYYPTIEFQSETWVKAAITYWDKIYRIVPPSYIPRDSDEIKIGISEGVIENINLTEEDLKETADKFEAYCNDLDWLPDGFETSRFEVRLHDEKIDERLKPYFKEFAGSMNKDGFYSVRPEIANGYMFFLSDTISKRRNLARLSDNEDMFTAMTYFDAEGNFDDWISDSEREEHYTNLILENVIPGDIRSIRMDRIIEIGAKLKNYKEEFREMTSEFAQNLSKIEDPKFALKELSKFKTNLEDSQLTRTEILSGVCKNLLPSALYVGIPTFTASLVGNLFTTRDDLFGLVTFASGATMASIATLMDSGKEVRKNWKSKRSNYYLDIRKDLTANEGGPIRFHNIQGRLDEFVND
jgi:hypothetical protein